MALRSTFTRFFQLEAASGLLLIAAAALALIVNNSPLSHLYAAFLDVPVVAQIGALKIAKPALLWINDGLMALFFLLIGLEVKRELLDGHLSKPSQVVLPGAAAIGGMVVPALIYWAINKDYPAALSGWAIPMATDIAFALGVLALLGKRVPVSLKLFLMTLAIIDDLGAIIVIAVFYSADLSGAALAGAGACLVALIAMNRLGVIKLGPYLIIGLILWVCVLKSGVHATLAGVTLAFCIPMRTKNAETSPLLTLEHALHPWVAYAILPLFAFANAGVSLTGVSLDSFTHHVPMGIAAGPADRQDHRRIRPDLAGHQDRPRGIAQRRQLGPGVRRGDPVRHRLHHEPVRRLPGVRTGRQRVCRRGSNGHPDRVDTGGLYGLCGNGDGESQKSLTVCRSRQAGSCFIRFLPL